MPINGWLTSPFSECLYILASDDFFDEISCPIYQLPFEFQYLHCLMVFLVSKMTH